MENWKDIVEEENWVSRVRIVLVFLMDWQALMPNVMSECLNTLLIKGAYIYYGRKDKVYVISKQLIVYVFGVCAKRYAKELKG